MNQVQVKLPSNGCDLHVTVMDHVQAQQVIVVLHGGPGSGAQPVIDLPAMDTLAQSFAMVHFDQRGSGQSTYHLSHRLTKEQIVEDVKCVVDYTRERFPDKDVMLWGGSFGGLLGLLFMEAYPDAVKRAVLSSPAIWIGHNNDPAFPMEYMKKCANALGDTHIAELVDQTSVTESAFAELFDSKTIADWFASYQEPIKGHEGIWHIHAMREWINSCDMRSSVADIQIPTLFLQGMDDPLCPAPILLDAIRQYPNENVTLKTFSPCGHGVFDDCTEAFCNICSAFYMA